MAAFPTPPDERQTLELLPRLAEGDSEAWDALYARYHDDLLFSIRAQLGTRLRGALQSEDVLQSVALEAFREMPRFEDRGQGSLRAFLHRLVVNKIRDRGRRENAQKRAGGVPLGDTLMGALEGAGGELEPTYHDPRYEKLERALAQLGDEQREVVVLRQMEGLSSKEVAERLGKSDDVVRKVFSRAMARLTLLAQEEDA